MEHLTVDFAINSEDADPFLSDAATTTTTIDSTLTNTDTSPSRILAEVGFSMDSVISHELLELDEPLEHEDELGDVIPIAANEPALLNDHHYVRREEFTTLTMSDTILYSQSDDDDDDEMETDKGEKRILNKMSDKNRNGRKVTKKYKKKTRRGQKRKVANTWSLMKDGTKKIAEIEEIPLGMKETEEANKKKLYEHKPFNNPELERCRLNALNAKRNREKKKEEQTKMMCEMRKLREENRTLKMIGQEMKGRAKAAEKALARVKRILESQHLGQIFQIANCKQVHENERQMISCKICNLDFEE